jgi:hypothetical protein
MNVGSSMPVMSTRIFDAPMSMHESLMNSHSG